MWNMFGKELTQRKREREGDTCRYISLSVCLCVCVLDMNASSQDWSPLVSPPTPWLHSFLAALQFSGAAQQFVKPRRAREEWGRGVTGNWCIIAAVFAYSATWPPREIHHQLRILIVLLATRISTHFLLFFAHAWHAAVPCGRGCTYTLWVRMCTAVGAKAWQHLHVDLPNCQSVRSDLPMTARRATRVYIILHTIVMRYLRKYLWNKLKTLLENYLSIFFLFLLMISNK